jgi:hypothetical protein
VLNGHTRIHRNSGHTRRTYVQRTDRIDTRLCEGTCTRRVVRLVNRTTFLGSWVVDTGTDTTQESNKSTSRRRSLYSNMELCFNHFSTLQRNNMGLFSRSPKVAQQEASLKEVSSPSSSPSTNNVTTIRERMSRVAKDDKPRPKPQPKPKKEIKREMKKKRNSEVKQLVKKKEERSNKIQALLAMRQANSQVCSR